jgi:phosphocarrier protein
VITTQITIINKLGLHARAAAKFVDCAKAFSSEIQVSIDGPPVDAKSIMAVMMLAAGKGTVLKLEINGSDKEEALSALHALIENRFGEPE